MANLNLRTSSNDPQYERITALRTYRSKNYWANIYLIIGILSLPIYGLGLVIIFLGIVKKINARHIKAKYKY